MAASSANGVIELLEKFLKILTEEHAFDRSDNYPIAQFVNRTELQKQMSLSLNDEPASEKEIETVIRQTIRYSMRTSGPHFHSQLYAGIDPYGLVGSWITDVLNTSQNNYHLAPIFALMENEVICMSLDLMGYPQLPRADGVMVTDSTMACVYALLSAMHHIGETKALGISRLSRLACFTNENNYDTTVNAANLLGLGTGTVYKVKTDDIGRMDLRHLKKIIIKAENKGRRPFFVNATAGTRALGAIDTFMKIADICLDKCLWLHVDASLGGTLILSRAHRCHLRGMERANSIVWNPHEMLGAPLQTSLFLVRSIVPFMRDIYLNYIIYNNIDMNKIVNEFNVNEREAFDPNMQCSRKVDAIKFCLMWKAYGTNGFRRLVAQAVHCATYLLQQINKTVGFRPLLSEYQCCNVCFWYIPPSMRNQEETQDWWERLYEVTIVIRKRLILKGSLMIDCASLPKMELGNFFCVAVKCQPVPTTSSMDYVINQIKKFGADL